MPSSTKVTSLREQANGEITIFQKFLEMHPAINFLRITYVDYFNVVRTTAVIPRSTALKLARSKYIPSFISPSLACIFYTGELNRGSLEIGIDELHFDWSSLRECKYSDSPGHATVMTFVRNPQDQKPSGGFGPDPRWLLCHQLEMARLFSFLIGHEIEFFLYSDATDFDVSPIAGSHASSANLYGYTHMLDEIVVGLEAVGIGINNYHAEGGPLGMFEIVLAPIEPILAADALVYAREMIRYTVKKHGMSATLSPTPFEKGLNIGGHLNISIHPHDLHEHFLAGLLEHLPAACAFLMPTYESGTRQRRLGTWLRWGVDNKLTVIRQRGKGFFEIRCVDGTANPYLAAGVIIAACMHGVRNKTTLSMKPLTEMTLDFSEEVRRSLGVAKKIPESLQEALDEL